MISIATLDHLTDADSLLQAADREAYHLTESDLIQYLKGVLGRPLNAHITSIADAKQRLALGIGTGDARPWHVGTAPHRCDPAYRDKRTC